MSAFKQKLARLGATAGVLAASTAAFMAVGGVTAGSALATPTCVTGGGNLGAQGSTLQREAQQLWTGREVPSAVGTPPYTKLTGGYAEKCAVAGDTTFSYAGTGSGAALNAFAMNGAALNKEFAYVGTDEAPTAAQITTATNTTGVAPLVMPVAQTSIAVIANIPSQCAISGGLKYADLNKLFAGTITKWSQVSTVANKGNCETEEAAEETASPGSAKITRVVRSDGSGTSYQFKNYLSELETTEGAVGPGSVNVGSGCVTRTWAQLRPNETPATGAPNTSWPESACDAGVTAVSKQSGGGGVAGFVAANANTIGYAALPDAEAKGAGLVSLQNEESVAHGPHYVSPVVGTHANCSERSYTVPSAGRDEGSNTGIGVDWSTTFGANPEIGGSEFPLCTLTFDIAWNGYATAGYTSGATVGSAVHDYLANYVLSTASGEGQKTLNTHFYNELPEAEGEAENDVLDAAKLTASHIH